MTEFPILHRAPRVLIRRRHFQILYTASLYSLVWSFEGLTLSIGSGVTEFQSSEIPANLKSKLQSLLATTALCYAVALLYSMYRIFSQQSWPGHMATTIILLLAGIIPLGVTERLIINISKLHDSRQSGLATFSINRLNRRYILGSSLCWGVLVLITIWDAIMRFLYRRYGFIVPALNEPTIARKKSNQNPTIAVSDGGAGTHSLLELSNHRGRLERLYHEQRLAEPSRHSHETSDRVVRGPDLASGHTSRPKLHPSVKYFDSLGQMTSAAWLLHLFFYLSTTLLDLISRGIRWGSKPYLTSSDQFALIALLIPLACFVVYAFLVHFRVPLDQKICGVLEYGLSMSIVFLLSFPLNLYAAIQNYLAGGSNYASFLHANLLGFSTIWIVVSICIEVVDVVRTR